MPLELPGGVGLGPGQRRSRRWRARAPGGTHRRRPAGSSSGSPAGHERKSADVLGRRHRTSRAHSARARTAALAGPPRGRPRSSGSGVAQDVNPRRRPEPTVAAVASPFGPPSRWRDDDLIGVSRDFDAAMVLDAYRGGSSRCRSVAADGLVVTAGPGDPAARRPASGEVAAQDARSVRDPRRHGFDAVLDRCADPRRPGGWIDGHPAPSTAAAPRGRRSLGGGVDPRRRAGRWSVRRQPRGAVRGGVDVPRPGDRTGRVQGGAGRVGRAAARGRRTAGCWTSSGGPAPGHPRRGRGRPRGTICARLAVGLASGRPPDWRRDHARGQERRGRRRRRGRLARLARAAASPRSPASTPARSSATSATGARCAAASSTPSRRGRGAGADRRRAARWPAPTSPATVTPGEPIELDGDGPALVGSTPGSSTRSSGSSASATAG